MAKEGEDKYKNEPVHMFCDGINIVTSPEAILLAMRSGGVLNAYLLTPAHTKRLLLALKDQIDKFEAVHGEIKAPLAPLAPGPMVSPLQQTDLGDDKKEG